jgi:5-(carboxyamino)imidazole ribonucleotide synthase
MKKPVYLPGSTIGVMGGGQLGRMFAIAARRMGYRVHSFSPEGDSPSGQLADIETAAPYADEAAVTEFAKSIDVLTFEFENIPARTIEWCAAHCEVRPAGSVLHIAQDRVREKEFLAGAGLPLAPFVAVDSEESLARATRKIGAPAVLKEASFGYDGKGQHAIFHGDDPARVWRASSGEQAVLEKFIPYVKELSVIVARGVDGAVATYPVCENTHRNHILDITTVPAGVAETTQRAARDLAVTAAEKFGLVGLLAVEMFLLENGALLINEVAPRPHNSGHFSFDACITSQFEQQLRAVCGLPLGATDLLRPVAMANLLGDLWKGREPDWAAAAAFPTVKLHLYGKATPRKGRKMGHLLAFGETAHAAEETVRQARARLSGPVPPAPAPTRA